MVVFFFFFCEEYSFGLFFRGVKIIGRSNPSSSRASSSSSSRHQSRRCASSSFDPTPFFIRGASASAQTKSSSSSPLRFWSSFFSLDSKSGDNFGDGGCFQKSPVGFVVAKNHRIIVCLCALFCRLFFVFFFVSSETLSLCVCVCVCTLSRARSLSRVCI